MDTSDRTTALYDKHKALDGRLVSFSGWELPVFYSSIVEEHMAVRTQVGVFDISHMGQIFVDGEGASSWLNTIFTNDVSSLNDGQGHYTFLLNESGGVIDDLILYRLGEDSYFLVVNAARDEEVFSTMVQHSNEDVTLKRLSDDYGALAIQGPSSPEVFTRISGGLTLPSRFGVDRLQLDGEDVIACRTGYTGEDGFEFFFKKGSSEKWFDAVLDTGAIPCGLGARDSLRLEVAYPLNGNDLSRDRTPLSAGLGFAVSLEKASFIGSNALKEEYENGCQEVLVGLKAEGKTPPFRAGYTVRSTDGTVIGELSSGVLSPCLNTSIGMAYLPSEFKKSGTSVEIGIRKNWFPAKVVKKPMYKK